MNIFSHNKQNGFSMIQAMIGIAVVSGASVILMNQFSQQEKNIKKQSGDVSINYMLHNITKVISARTVCEYSYKSGDKGEDMPLLNGYELNKIAMPSSTGGDDLIVAKIETEQTATKGGKLGFWISKITVDDIEPAFAVNIRKAKLWLEFNRRIDSKTVKTEKNFLDIFLVEEGGKVISCYGDEDFNAKAFCETALRGQFDNATKLCKGIAVSPRVATPDNPATYAMATVREEYQDDTYRSDIRIEGGAKLAKWIKTSPTGSPEVKYITIENGNISDAKVVIVDDGVYANDVTATRYNHSSDRRLKENIKKLSLKASNDITKLNGVSFRWKHNQQNSLGFIAQDVEKVYPTLVSTNPQTGKKAVDYAGLVPLMLEKVKSQQRDIDELKNRIEKLKERK
jgi:Tfp pilus assembly protein PilV